MLRVELDGLEEALDWDLNLDPLEKRVAELAADTLRKQIGEGKDAQGVALPALSKATVERRARRKAEGGRVDSLTVPLHESGGLASSVVVESRGGAVEVVVVSGVARDGSKLNALAHYGMSRFEGLPPACDKGVDELLGKEGDRILSGAKAR